ncbi:hypothetical protein EV127DRAFT_353860 [Xylaria flabelliformis]|nr:hypothetical protein EV127DRAFT_353860 [Xylaria flabelliformis]
MDSTDTSFLDAGPSHVGGRAQKRRASRSQKVESPRKKQKPQPKPKQKPQPKPKPKPQPKSQPKRPCTRAQKKGKASVANGDNTPEPAGTTLSTTTLSPPSSQPPASSKIRAALCDSVEFWRAHQGGIQSNDKIASGMLLNGKTTPRDVIQSQVIVTTVGSGLKLGTDRKRIRTEDQKDTSKNYVALKNSMEIGKPIGIVVGKQQAEQKGHYTNDLLSVELTNHYNVLDWFFITDIWSERQPTQRDGSSYMQYMVRLQSIELDSHPWWLPQGQERADAHAIGDFHCQQFICQSCDNLSKEIFKEGWCCLKHTCSKFFQFSNADIDFDTLRYNENFLNERKQWISEAPLKDLVPGLPIMESEHYGSESQFKRGIVCPTCKFASRRISWEGWKCENGCGFELSMIPRDVPMTKIHREALKTMNKKHRKFFEIDARIGCASHSVAGYEVTSFYLPNTPENLKLGKAKFIGSVTIFRPMKSTRERKDGLDDLFQEIQKATRVGDVKLQRHPAFCRGSHMEELTSHFSCNMGADYKFGVVVETSNGFDTAPDPVMKALSRLTWSGAAALSVDSDSMPGNFIDFNEQLMLGYFEDSQISFHDDGEKELGPTVATLSLGSPSIMRFRGKKKAGFEKTIASDNVMLSFVLEHGDSVIMHGTKIHQIYEHAVHAEGVRRYALTCRYIRPEMIPDRERREKAIVNGKVPTYWQKQAYRGESTEAVYTV